MAQVNRRREAGVSGSSHPVDGRYVQSESDGTNPPNGL